MRGWVCRLGLLSLVAALFTASPGVAPAQAATESEAVAVPLNLRGEPRAGGVVGEGPAGLVYMREAEPTTASSIGAVETILRAPDGTETVLDGPVGRMYGDRLVTNAGSSAVRSRILPDGEWQTLQVPAGFELVATTGDGLLLVHGVWEDRELALLPWDGGSPLPIEGFPSGRVVTTIVGTFSDASGAVVYTQEPSVRSESVYVDTASLRAFPLDFAASDWGMNEDTLAWLTYSESDGRVIGTMRRPHEGEPLPPTARRAAPALPDAGEFYDVSLPPVGEDVVVWRGDAQWARSYAGTGSPVLAVNPDGDARQLLEWGQAVRPGATGEVLAFGSDAPQAPEVRRLDVVSGESSVEVEFAPVPAWVTQVAVVDDGVAHVDTSERAGALNERSVSAGADGALALGAEERVASPAAQYSCWNDNDLRSCSYLVAGDGSLAWLDGNTSSTRRWNLRTAEGTVRTGAFPQSTYPKSLTAVSGDWLLLDGQYLIDTRTNTMTTLQNGGGADLLDGVAYVPGTALETAPYDSVIMRSLDAARVDSLPIPGCSRVYSVRAAGSWLLVGCTIDSAFPDLTRATFVVDRTGQTPTWIINEGGLYLGNGFVVRRDKSGSLTWTPLAGAAADWRDLGTAATQWSTASVSRGAVPNVAWVDPTGQAHVKRLPVETSPVPPHPTTPLPVPTAANVTADPGDGRVTLRWNPANPAEQIRGYVVRGNGGYLKLGPDATSTSFTGLRNGTTYTFWVTAQNLAGKTTTTVTATPLGRPAAPQNIQVTVDEVHSTAEVTWTWTQAPATEPVESFDIWAGLLVETGLPASARSASITVPWPVTGPITVDANGEHGSRSADSAPVTFPGVDTSAPTVAAPAVPRVLLGAKVDVALKASDDRALDSVDLRWRSAGPGEALGSWRYPSGWQRRGVGTVGVTGLKRGHTYCFSSRARDAVGNLSSWTARRCTTVAMDDRALSRTGEWSLPDGSRFYLGTASATSSRLAALQRLDVRADAAWLVATTCPTCGAVRVQVGHEEWGKVRLRSSARRDRQVIALPWPMRLQGRLVLRPVAGTGRVTIDGIALRSY
ncbi:MAG: fibronectin type III domain-containing protein [Nocardioidaceae bacterium]